MTTPPSALPPANWYPDPQKPGQLRYWDGQRWTQHVHPLEQQPAQGASGYASPGPQTAANPMSQAVQQSDAGVYTPVIQSSPLTSARPETGSVPAVGPTTGGTIMPDGQRAAGPATGGTFIPTGAAGAAGAFPATGSTPTFQPTGSSVGGQTAASPGMLQVPTPRELDDDDLDGTTPTAPVAALSVVIGVVAFGAIVLGVVGLETDFDQYLPYAGAGLGFVAVLLGFLGRRRAAAGFLGGTLFAWSGITIGFMAMLLATYEIMYPGALYADFFGRFLE